MESDKYYEPSTGNIYSYTQVRYMYGHISIPKNKNLPELGLYLFFLDPIPDLEENQYFLPDIVELRDDGFYYQTWVVITVEEEDQ